MLDIPFHLENIPAASADKVLEQLLHQRIDAVPVLLGDADVFSAEWAEIVDLFEPPEAVLEEALKIEIDTWFDHQTGIEAQALRQVHTFNRFYRAAALPFDLILLPIRLAGWPLTGRRPTFFSRSPFDAKTEGRDEDDWIRMLRTQLAELEASGDASQDELDEISRTIDEIAADGVNVFPDPVAYVTPRHGETLAAALVMVDASWKAAAWLQHGTYALCVPKPVFVAHCKWLEERHGGRIITASTDAVGFQMDRPIEALGDAAEVLRRFSALGATEVNADHHGGDGKSLVGAKRLWVWWD